MKRIIKKYIHIIFVGILLAVLQMLALTKVQFIKGNILNVAIEKNISLLPQIILTLFVAIFLMSLFGYLFSFVNCIFMEKCSYTLRELFFKSFLNHSYKEFFHLKEGEIISKYSKELSVIEYDCFSMVGSFVQMILQIVFIVVSLFYLNIVLAVLSLIILSFPVFVPKIFQKRVSISSESKLVKTEKNISVFSSILSGFELIRNFGIEKNIIKQFEESNKNLAKAEDNYERANAVSSGVSFAVSLGSQALIMIITGFYVYQGYLGTGDFITIAGLVAALRVPLFWVSSMFQKIISTKPFRISVFEFIDKNNNKENIEFTNYLNNNKDLSIEINGVSYAYNDENPILNHVDLHFDFNHKYLIVGESGSGKSTLMNLLLGYDVPSTGSIQLNHKNIQEMKGMENLITISGQEATIFDGTIRDNLTMYQNDLYKDDELLDILKKVGMESFVEKGLDYRLEEKGSNLSGGEKKRISLARAFIRNTPILILDEPLANLDKENIDRIEDFILGIHNKLVLIISHQISEKLRNNVDSIIEFKKGDKRNVEVLSKI